MKLHGTVWYRVNLNLSNSAQPWHKSNESCFWNMQSSRMATCSGTNRTGIILFPAWKTQNLSMCALLKVSFETNVGVAHGHNLADWKLQTRKSDQKIMGSCLSSGSQRPPRHYSNPSKSQVIQREYQHQGGRHTTNSGKIITGKEMQTINGGIEKLNLCLKNGLKSYELKNKAK